MKSTITVKTFGSSWPRIINRSCSTSKPPCSESSITTTFNYNIHVMAQSRIDNYGDKIIIVDMEKGAESIMSYTPPATCLITCIHLKQVIPKWRCFGLLPLMISCRWSTARTLRSNAFEISGTD